MRFITYYIALTALSSCKLSKNQANINSQGELKKAELSEYCVHTNNALDFLDKEKAQKDYGLKVRDASTRIIVGSLKSLGVTTESLLKKYKTQSSTCLERGKDDITCHDIYDFLEIIETVPIVKKYVPKDLSIESLSNELDNLHKSYNQSRLIYKSSHSKNSFKKSPYTYSPEIYALIAAGKQEYVEKINTNYGYCTLQDEFVKNYNNFLKHNWMHTGLQIAASFTISFGVQLIPFLQGPHGSALAVVGNLAVDAAVITKSLDNLNNVKAKINQAKAIASSEEEIANIENRYDSELKRTQINLFSDVAGFVVGQAFAYLVFPSLGPIVKGYFKSGQAVMERGFLIVKNPVTNVIEKIKIPHVDVFLKNFAGAVDEKVLKKLKQAYLAAFDQVPNKVRNKETGKAVSLNVADYKKYLTESMGDKALANTVKQELDVLSMAYRNKNLQKIQDTLMSITKNINQEIQQSLAEHGGKPTNGVKDTTQHLEFIIRDYKSYVETQSNGLSSIHQHIIDYDDFVIALISNPKNASLHYSKMLDIINRFSKNLNLTEQDMIDFKKFYYPYVKNSTTPGSIKTIPHSMNPKALLKSKILDVSKIQSHINQIFGKYENSANFRVVHDFVKRYNKIAAEQNKNLLKSQEDLAKVIQEYSDNKYNTIVELMLKEKDNVVDLVPGQMSVVESIQILGAKSPSEKGLYSIFNGFNKKNNKLIISEIKNTFNEMDKLYKNSSDAFEVLSTKKDILDNYFKFLLNDPTVPSNLKKYISDVDNNIHLLDFIIENHSKGSFEELYTRINTYYSTNKFKGALFHWETYLNFQY